MAGAQVTRQSWAVSLLTALGLPTSPQNVKVIVAWEVGEGGAGPQFGVSNNTANFNPLNTTQDAAGASNTGVQGNIKSYPDWQTGLAATVKTLQNGSYQSILSMLQSGNPDPSAAASTINNSVWGTKDLTAALIQGAPVSTSDQGA